MRYTDEAGHKTNAKMGKAGQKKAFYTKRTGQDDMERLGGDADRDARIGGGGVCEPRVNGYTQIVLHDAGPGR